ncbi:MAG: hypothetical protein AB1394_13410, partial [Bacteroidota bacterium]
MANTSGITQLAIMQGDTLAGVPTGVILLGLVSNQNFETKDTMVSKIERDDYEIAHQKLLTFSADTLQPSLYAYMTLLSYRGGNCDVQAILENGMVYKFFKATNPIGIEPVLYIDDESRTIKVKLEASFPTAVWQAMELAAASAAAVVLNNPQSGRDSAKLRKSSPLFTQSPNAVEMFPNYSKRTMEISPAVKSKCHPGGKQSWNIPLFDRVQVSGVFQTEDASKTQQYNQEAKGMFPELWLKDANAGNYYDMLKFEAGCLQQVVK